MRIGILSRNPKCYSTKRLVEAATSKGHEAKVVNALKCYMNITANKPVIHFKNNHIHEKLEFDAIIPRIGAAITSYGTAVLRQFEVASTYVANDSVAIARSRDKLRAHQLLARKGVGMPKTSYAHSSNSTQDLMKFVGGAPLIVKVLQSTHGRGVLLAETDKAAESLINAFLNLRTDFLVQEFIKEAGGADIRCLVIGDKVVAAMKRQALDGEFRSNLHRGATAHPIKLKPEERAIAVMAAKVLGLKIAGVDIVTSSRGPLVLEVNSSPGLQGIEKATKKDVAGAIIDFLVKDAAKGPNKNLKG